MEKEGEVTIRRAKLSDVNEIYNLGLKTEELEFSSEFPFHEKSELKEFISKPMENILLVALIDKNIVGFIYSKILSRRGDGWCMLDNIAVLKKYRNHGIGTCLLEKTCDELKKRKIYYVQLLEEMHHKKTRLFWKHRGFKEKKDICLGRGDDKMSYPKFKNKYIEEASFNPEDFIGYKKFSSKIPNNIILFYSDSILRYIKRNYALKKINIYSLLTIYVYKNIGFVKITGVGSPLAAGILEEIIALGGKTFLNIGTAGGLQDEGVFLCQKALRDEGTSYHYFPHGHFTCPDKDLTKKLGISMKKLGIDYHEGITWTIDAPYRETKAEVKKYSKNGIFTVEMEASALFAVAKYRKVKMASAFVVSDMLGKKWLPKFHRFDVKKQLHKLIDAAVECLEK